MKGKIKKLSLISNLFLSAIIFVSCGGARTPVTSQTPALNNSIDIPSMPKFKTAQEALKWVARFYKQVDIDIDNLYGQLESIYNSGVALGHVFILARLSYVTGIDPVDLLKIKEGDVGWTAVMDAFQITGLGGYTNLGEYLTKTKSNKGTDYPVPTY